jgi:hypothetical protein
MGRDFRKQFLFAALSAANLPDGMTSEPCCMVINISVPYSEGSQIETHPGDRLPWLRIVLPFILVSYLKIGYYNLHPVTLVIIFVGLVSQVIKFPTSELNDAPLYL